MEAVKILNARSRPVLVKKKNLDMEDNIFELDNDSLAHERSNEEKQYELLKSITINKQFINESAQNLIQIVEEGHHNPLEAKLKLKALESIISIAYEKIDGLAREEAEVYNQRSFEKFGARIELIEAGTKYDYSFCNDPVHLDLTRRLNEIKQEIKERETFLKSIKDSMSINIEDTGEVVTVYPPRKTSTPTLKITFK